MPSPTETLVAGDGVDLCVETFGRAEDPPILLIMGGGASLLWWEEDFCERLADGSGGRFVIRFDQRDTGRTTRRAAVTGSYSLDDLAADALSIVDDLGLASVHAVGFSLGGLVALLLALDHPEQVASLTLMSTTPGGAGLPPITDGLLEHFDTSVTPDWTDRDAAVEYLVADMRAHASRSQLFDEDAARDLAARDFERTIDLPEKMTSEGPAGGRPVRERLGELRVPTLVVHGSEDPLFPLGHARVLAGEIPGAELLVLEGVGHELPRRVWEAVVPAILRHTAGG